RANIDAIEFKGQHAGKRDECGKGKIVMRKSPHFGAGRKKLNNYAAEKKRGERKPAAKTRHQKSVKRTALRKLLPSRAPRDCPHNCSAAAVIPSRKKAPKENEIVQHRIGSQNGIAAARALRIEEHEGEEECRVADKYVAIDRKHPGNFPRSKTSFQS